MMVCFELSITVDEYEFETPLKRHALMSVRVLAAALKPQTLYFVTMQSFPSLAAFRFIVPRINATEIEKIMLGPVSPPVSILLQMQREKLEG